MKVYIINKVDSYLDERDTATTITDHCVGEIFLNKEDAIHAAYVMAEEAKTTLDVIYEDNVEIDRRKDHVDLRFNSWDLRMIEFIIQEHEVIGS